LIWTAVIHAALYFTRRAFDYTYTDRILRKYHYYFYYWEI